MQNGPTDFIHRDTIVPSGLDDHIPKSEGKFLKLEQMSYNDNMPSVI